MLSIKSLASSIMDLEYALRQWKDILGASHVIADRQQVANAETATYSTTQTISAIIRPGTKEELQECLRTATRCRVPVYPLSSGKNWGYGSRVPPTDQSVIIDLSRINRIIDFDEKLGYVTVEPGVTQRQLYAFLKEKRSNLWMDATGSSQDCSLIGNTMERGFGHTPHGDHAGFICGLEVVLATGDVLETGYSRFANTRLGPLNRWGLGPSIDGLFTQSNLGIVCRMTIWLMPKPDQFEAFFFKCNRPEGLSQLIDALRPLRMADILRSAVHIGNAYKVLGGISQYPWEKTAGKTPLTPAQLTAIRSRMDFGVWNASGGIYGTPAQVSEAKRLLKRAVSSIDGSLQTLSERKLKFARTFAKPLSLVTRRDMRSTVDLVEVVMGLMKGIPTDSALGSAYWRKRGPIPNSPDPDRDRCGLLWYAPVVPAIGADVAKLTETASEIMLRHGFEPMISLTLLTPRSVYCVTSICYDRDIPGEDVRATACHREVADWCAQEGYLPYRLGLASMDQMGRDTGFGRLLQGIRQTVDPGGILAPGRYEHRDAVPLA
jgi:4-cresol dehydrogenase (hydroxylating) flavoprotein subunit